ncbi:TonB-dependent receptor domain-containing protein [Alicycliphilus sp. T452]
MNPFLRAGALRPSALALAALAACAVQAQEGAAPVLSDVVVTATRTAQPLTDVLADVSIVDREAIEQSGAAALGDVLARLPGIEMSRSGGLGGTTSMYVRGAETRFTAVYIDGVRVDSQAGSGGTTWEAIPLAQIERIEVLRGPAAAIYGSDAVAGVVQIFTRKGEAGVAPYVGVGAGTHGTYRAEAGVSGASGAVDYALGIARETSKGFNAKKDGNPDRDDYQGTSASGRLGWQLNTAHRLEGNFLYNDTDSGYDVSKTADDRSLHRLQGLGLNWQAQWSGSYKTRLSVTDSRDRYETKPSAYFTDTRQRGYLFFNELRVGAHQFTAALERREDELTNASISSGTRDRAQNALALGWGLRLGAHTVQLNARHDEDSEFGGKTTGSAAYGYAFTPNWRATASAGTAFKAPTLYQRFSMYGDDTLRPETSRNVELGLKWAERSNSFSATLYRNNVSNLIDWQGNTGTCAGNSGPYPGCYANVGRARYEGLTLAGAYGLGGVRLRGSLDLQNPKNLDTGRQLGRRAKQHAVLGADTLLAGWTLGAEAQISGKRYDNNNANAPRLGGYTLFNLYASTRVARDYLVYARLDNLADKNYELARNYATAGRTFFVGVKWAPAH